MEYKLYNNDCLEQLDQLEENSIDSIVTDPPYELNFMSKGWDNAGISFNKELWEKCLRVLKPGGYLLAFGGSRTFHRIAVAIEDAGFEIRDTIMWLYGSGFPKSMNIGLAIDKKEGLQGQRGIGGFNVGGIQEQQNRKAKLYIGSTTDGSKQKTYTDYKSDLAKQWQGYGTALKPSFEPIIVARKPFKGSLVDNVIEYGVGGINIDECRVGNEERQNPQAGFIRRGRTNEEVFMGTDKNRPEGTLTVNGRFPANTILTYDETDVDEVCGGLPNTNPSKQIIGGANRKSQTQEGRISAGGWKETNRIKKTEGYNDNGGSASRYFYCAKASKKDRDEGLEEFDDKYMAFSNQAKAELKRGNVEFKGNEDNPMNFVNSVSIRKNTHPTVKPTELMQYLVRLVTPKGGKILDPFMGSGSTGKAVMFENKERDANYKFIGIEREKEYYEIANARIKWAEEYKEETLDSMQININEILEE